MQPAESREARFSELVAEYRSTAKPRLPDESVFAALRVEASQIRLSGRWVSGPGDLLTILGRHRDELFHSRLLGWLLNPTGRHGLGDRFLRSFLGSAWPGESLVDGGTVEIELERTRSGVSAVTDELLEARADLVIRLESSVIVVENKLDAGEQQTQCERLYWAWASEPTEVRWLFLTPTGGSPVTATSPAARAAWRPMSYREVRQALATVLDESDGPAGMGRSSALQYLATVTSQEAR